MPTTGAGTVPASVIKFHEVFQISQCFLSE